MQSNPTSMITPAAADAIQSAALATIMQANLAHEDIFRQCLLDEITQRNVDLNRPAENTASSAIARPSHYFYATFLSFSFSLP
jgi:hypothetical protein